MGALSSADILAIALGVLLVAILAGIGLFLLRRLRQRRDELKAGLSGRPDLIGDRAFNRIAMARRESEILSGRGASVGRATDLVVQAQAAFDARDFGRAYELAQSAHESLVSARMAGPPIASATPAAPPRAAAGDILSSTLEPFARSDPVPTVAKIPKNRAESQFQIRILSTELEEARSTRPTADATTQAAASLAAAQAASDRADYTEAFRMALRGRKQVGGSVEAVAPAPGRAGRSPAAESATGDPALAAETVASAERCASCGQPILRGDTFCRGCGTPRAAPLCSRCGAPRHSADAFCGKCGAAFA